MLVPAKYEPTARPVIVYTPLAFVLALATKLPDVVRNGVTFRLVETMDEVLEIALNPGESRQSVQRDPDEERVHLAH